MASGATKSHIFQQLFSIKILTKLSYWVKIIKIILTPYIFLGNFFNFNT
jgi:hypothetical protein